MDEAQKEFKRTLRVLDAERFYAARLKSSKIPKGNRTLEDCVMYLMLGHYGDADTLVLYNDFVPHSFGFELQKNGDRILNGGIILHGQGTETFSVELVGESGLHYSIHT